jgi:hypothetical protein
VTPWSDTFLLRGDERLFNMLHSILLCLFRNRQTSDKPSRQGGGIAECLGHCIRPSFESVTPGHASFFV